MADQLREILKAGDATQTRCRDSLAELRAHATQTVAIPVQPDPVKTPEVVPWYKKLFGKIGGWTVIAVVWLELGCVGTKTGDRLREGCDYLTEYQGYIQAGTAVIPHEDTAFYAGLTFRNLEYLCEEMRRIDKHEGSEEPDG